MTFIEQVQAEIVVNRCPATAPVAVAANSKNPFESVVIGLQMSLKIASYAPRQPHFHFSCWITHAGHQVKTFTFRAAALPLICPIETH